jgi:hypothetical protein
MPEEDENSRYFLIKNPYFLTWIWACSLLIELVVEVFN